MNNCKWLMFCLLFLTASFGLSQKDVTISGYVKDASSGETLIGATVYVPELQLGSSTNVYGFYSITIPEGSYRLEWGYVGFSDYAETIKLNSNLKKDIELGIEAAQMDEVVIVAEAKDKNVRDIQMSVNKLDIQTLQKLPTLLGETEVLRSIQLLPGVTSVGEGAAGFNVRGGSIDQNLVLLDEAPVYNSSHLFGFFSVFNPDAVKDVKLYKGGIPARYGGRLSSILDVRMKEGNNKKLAVNGGIGTIFSRLAIEAPIVKDKSSFIIAGRRSYIDWLSRPFLSDEFANTALNFYDLTLKTNYKINENNQIFVSGYFGRDNFRFGDAAGFNWGNSTATLRWNHLFSDRLFFNLTSYYSNYDYQINFGDTAEDKFDWSARIINYSLKPQFSYFLKPTNVIRFGGQSILYEFQPANAIAVSNNEAIDISLDKQYAFESNIFVENELDVGSRIKLNYGLRLSLFNYVGKGNAYEYGEAPAGEVKPFVSSTSYDQWENIQTYWNLEPRASIKYQMNETSSIKLSYNRTAQYIHLLSNTIAATPVDVWTPSTNNIKPQLADQVAMGFFKNLDEDKYEMSAEIYYKSMDNLVDYIDGADLILNQFLEGQILEGEGRAYGLELMAKKKEGRFSGWLSYTLARTERQVVGINNNQWYPARFDQLHNLSVTTFYDITNRLTLSANFVFNSGTPTTFASSRFEQAGFVIPNNDNNARNDVRIPNYHRMDLSLTINPKEKPGKKYFGKWIIGVYNLYNRKNAFSVYQSQDLDRVAPMGETTSEALRLAVIGSVIPSISYNFNF